MMQGKMLQAVPLARRTRLPIDAPITLKGPSILRFLPLYQRLLAEREEELRVAKKAATEAQALKADHSAAVSQLKEEHRNEMYLLQVTALCIFIYPEEWSLLLDCPPTTRKLIHSGQTKAMLLASYETLILQILLLRHRRLDR